MANPMKVRTKLEGEVALIRILMSHPMETGLRKDADGNLIPAHFIQLVTITHKDKEVLSAQWGPAVSRNPYLAFRIKGAAKGDPIKITWVDNKGDTRTDQATIE